MAYTTATVNAWYQAVQFQNGPTATVNSWVSGLNSGTITPTQVQNSIITQDAYTSGVVNPVLRLYQSSFNSVPDQAGQAYWVGQFGSGAQTYAQIANGFANSAQFQAIYANTSATQIANTAQVTLLYQNILQRLPDAGGLAYWTTQTIGTALAGISSSPEMINVSSVPIQNFQAAEIAGTAATTGSLYNYPGFPTTNYNLTTGIDAPGSGAFASSTGFSVSNNSVVNGIFNGGTAQTYNPGDVITAPSGSSNTTLSLTDGGAVAATQNITGLPATVTNIANVNVFSSQGIIFDGVTGTNKFTGTTQLNVTNALTTTITAAATTGVTVNNSGLGGNAIQINGGNAVSVTSTGTVGAAPANAITVGATTAAAGNVTINSTTANTATGTGGVITVTGGKAVSVTSTTTPTTANGVTITLGDVTVTGNANTTSVSVIQTGAQAAAAAQVAVAGNTAAGQNAVAARSGVANGLVTINDANAGSTTVKGTIASVTLQNYSANATISSSALTSLTLSNTGLTQSGTLGLTSGLASGNPTTLALNLGGGTLGVITDNSNAFTTINAALTANTTLGGFTGTALRTVAVTGTGIVTFSAFNSAVTSLTSTGAGGINANVSGATGLTSINFSTSTANNVLTLNAALQAFTGGSGNDRITIAADATRAITGGTGTDIIVLNAAAGTFTTANTVANVTGFETLGLNTGSQGTYNLATLTNLSSIGAVTLYGAVAAATTVSGIGSGVALNINAAQTNAFTYQLASTTGATSSATVNLTGSNVLAVNGGGTTGYTISALTLQDANAIGIGTLNFNTTASVGGGAFTITTLTDSALSAVNIAGSGALNVTNVVSTNSTTLTIADNNTSSATSTWGGITSVGNALGNIAFTGSKAFTVTALVDNVANLTISNTNTGDTGVVTFTNNWENTNTGASSVTLTGSVAINADLSDSTSVVSVAATTNNQAVQFYTGNQNDIINLGSGVTYVRGAVGADKVSIVADGNIDHIQLATDAGAAGGESGTYANQVTNSISTTTFDVYTGYNIGDKIEVGTSANGGAFGAPGTYATIGGNADGQMVTAANSATSVVTATIADNSVTLIRGSYTGGGTNTFVGSSTGADTLLVIDTDTDNGTTAYEAVVLVGYVNTGTYAAAVTGILTL
jgi:S-layer protein